MAYPLRLTDMADWFGRSPSYMSSICTDVVIHLQTRFQAFLHWDKHRLTKEKLRSYARHIDKVGGGDLVWGYVDGTLQKICRPSENQRLYYSGHKHYHGFKYQGVISPDGIFSSFFGPIIGSRGDWYIFGKSGLEEIVEELFEGDAAGALYIYGDPAYHGSRATMGAYRRPPRRQLTREQQEFNAQMSKKRVSVEHGFGHIQQKWMRNSYHLTLRVGQTPVASYYLAAALLANFMTCLRGNQISRAFQCEPPTLEEYLRVFRQDT